MKGGAHRNAKEQAELIDQHLKIALAELMNKEILNLLASRYNKYRMIGEFSFTQAEVKMR